MDFFFLKDIDTIDHHIGGKAKNLYRLKNIYPHIPKWIVVPAEVLNQNTNKNVDVIAGIDIPQSFVDDIIKEFPAGTLFAVRSSAIDEDSPEFSFAGQYESFLFVTKDELAEKIKEVWKSAFSERVTAYRKNHNLQEQSGIAVIVQQMVDAEASGVGYGIHPADGNRKVKMISAVYGLGEGIVSGDLNADNYIVQDNNIIKEIAHKDFKVAFNSREKSGTVKIPVAEAESKKQALTDEQIKHIAYILELCKREFGKPQDIEFAVKDNIVYLLQSRPVTVLHKLADTSGEYVLWDNSNIIESYPGVTTPLTFSFIKASYEGAYKLFSRFLGVDAKTIQKHERVFANTLGLINGRVYYNLRNWYMMLAMLPGYSINARYMEKMMGVKERFDIPADLQMSKTAAWWKLAKMAVHMYRRYLSLPRKRKEFMQLLEQTITEYKNIDYENKNANELMQLYLVFEKKLLNEWKAPLLNDFFAMIWFGLLEKRSRDYIKSDNPNIHNDLLCGSSDIISTQPIHRSIDIATKIAANEDWKNIFVQHDEQVIWQMILNEPGRFEPLKKDIEDYIKDFGERCVGELKLETISYTQDPSQFVKVLKSYVEANINASATSGKTEERLRQAAEKELHDKLRGKLLKKWMLLKTVSRARDLVSSRENLRYERTRAFGIVRELFSHIGKNFYAENIISNARDIFYLTKEEIFSFIEGTAVTQNVKELVELRKKEFTQYAGMEAPASRFATYGPVYHANDFKAKETEMPEGDLKGIGCCPGRVKARVQVILNAKEATPLNGDILVTISTDPGWVTLFPAAGGILVERGSLLSHSAIVAREMGKPCVVGITGLTKILKTGDVVEMDGNTGIVKLVEQT